jgi:uncharacterized protein (TIGR00369 family)
MIQPRVAESFGRQALMTTLGARLLHADAGLCRVAAPVLPGFTQQHGYGHAGVTFALGDTASGYAALSLMPEGAEVLTAEMKVNLLAPARGDLLVAEGRVIRPGRRLVVVTAEVRAGETLVALLQGTMIPV